MSTCSLCGSGAVSPFFEDERRAYLRCARCALVFVPSSFWLTSAQERVVYDLHENDPSDQGYRHFLSRLAHPLLERLAPNQRGLDFGCGPGPTLSVMLEEAGHSVALYDPFYYPNRGVLETSYDFVCSTEVVEHLQRPGREFERLFAMLKPGGWLGLMTKLVVDREVFGRWHYIRDPTHISFYSELTFTYLGCRFGADVHRFGKDVILFKKRVSRSVEGAGL